MNYDILLEKAKDLINRSFEGIYDKSGAPYVMHPIRVSERCESSKEKLVALLHDVLEDTSVTKEELYDIFPSEIVEAVIILTIRENEEYSSYIDRIINSKNKLALKVKQADMLDNQDEERLNKLDKKERERLINKYKDNYKKIVNALEGLD